MNLAGLIKEFVAEASEHIVTAEEDVLALEDGSADAKDAITRLFRSLHTIKGGAACVKFDAIKDFAHAMENIAGRLREGSLEINSQITQALLEGVDKLKSGIASGNGSLGNVGPLLERLHRISDSLHIQEQSHVQSHSHAFDLRHYDTREVKSQGLHIYEINLDLQKHCAQRSCTAASFLETIGSLGEILGTIPDSIHFTQDAPSFHDASFLLATMIDDPEVLFPGLEIQPSSYVHYTPEEFPDFRPVAMQSVEHAPETTILEPSASFTARPVEQMVRIPVEIADKLMNLAGELVVVRNRSAQLQYSGNTREISAVNQRLNVVTSDIQRIVMRTRMQAIGTVFSRFSRIVRDLGRTLGKEVELDVAGSDVELDKSLVDGLVEPLMHLVRNAVDHGIESVEERRARGKTAVGHISLKAQHLAGLVNIQVIDDGKGMDPAGLRAAVVEKGLMTQSQVELISDRESMNLIFLPGFSTAKEITDVSGRGVGMDVVRASLLKLGGVVEIQSAVGVGSSISIQLPLTLAIIPAIILAVEDQCFAVPQVNVIEVVWLHGDDVYQSIQTINGSEVYWLRGELLPLIRLSKVLNIRRTYKDPQTGEIKEDNRAEVADRRQSCDSLYSGSRSGPKDRRISVDNSLYIIVLRVGSDSFGLCVERIVDMEEIVVKPLHDRLKASKVYAGVTVLGDGTTSFILDVGELARTGGVSFDKAVAVQSKAASSQDETQKMLIFSNGVERFAVPLSLLMRVDEMSVNEIQLARNREYFCFHNELIPIVRVEAAIPEITSKYDREYLYAIIPKIGRPVSIAAASIIGIAEVENTHLVHSDKHNAIIGSQIVNGIATTVLDICALVECIEPGWLASVDQQIRHRLLIVEDSYLYLALLSSFMRGIGFDVLTAKNGKEALDILAQSKVDCVLSDIEMPIMDGMELARQLKANPATSHIPLLGASAMDERLLRPRALDAGFDDFRSKTNLPILGEAITTLFLQRQQRVDHA